MLSLLAGWAERAEQVNKKRRRGEMEGRVVDHKKPWGAFKEPSADEVVAKFLSRLSRNQSNDCVEWAGARIKTNGHGTVRIASRNLLAHRVAWIIENGQIPDGIEVCHKCDNPPCCNMDHLFLGSHGDNMADCKSKGRNKIPNLRGEDCGKSKLTENQVSEIRSIGSGVPQRALAKKYGVSQFAIGSILRNKTWTHIK